MVTSLLALLLLQTPPLPVVQMNTPTVPSVQLFADGAVVLPPLPAGTALRTPPQDSNDVALIFNQFGRKMCGLAPTIPEVKAELEASKIVCPVK